MRRITGTGRRARTTAAAAIVAAVTGAVLAVATAAQASWTPITTLTASGWEGVSAAISVDSQGDFLSAWSGISPTNTTHNCHQQTQIRIRFRTGKLGNVEQLTPCGQPDSFFPAVAQNANGYGVAAWIFSGTNGIQARLISPTGKLGPLLTVTPKDYQADLVNVAMSPTGQALVTWHEVSSTARRFPNTILARFIGSNSVLGPVRYIDGATPQLPAVVFDKAGTATIGWSLGGDATRALRLTPRGMTKVVNIFGPKPGTYFGVPKLAEDRNGDTFVLATTQTTLLLRKWSRSGALGPVITVASPHSALSVTNFVDYPSLGVDGVGNAVVAWDSALSYNSAAVWGRRVSATGRLGSLVRLGSGYLPEAAVAAGGPGVVTWQPVPLGSPYPSKIFGRRASATAGTFGAQLQFTGDGGYASVAADPAGVFGVIWVKSSLGSFIQARFGR